MYPTHLRLATDFKPLQFIIFFNLCLHMNALINEDRKIPLIKNVKKPFNHDNILNTDSNAV